MNDLPRTRRPVDADPLNTVASSAPASISGLRCARWLQAMAHGCSVTSDPPTADFLQQRLEIAFTRMLPRP